jgi:hypothetical protein
VSQLLTLFTTLVVYIYMDRLGPIRDDEGKRNATGSLGYFLAPRPSKKSVLILALQFTAYRSIAASTRTNAGRACHPS